MGKFFLIIFFTLLTCNQLQAAYVTKKKGDKVLINLEEDTINIDDRFYLINSENRPVAAIKILAIKNKEAVGIILKGNAEGNEKLKPIEKSSTQDLDKKESNAKFVKNKRNQKISVLGTYVFSAVSANVSDNTNAETLTTTGKGIGLSINYELYRWKKISFDGLIRYYSQDSKGESSLTACDNYTSTTCSTKISYVDLGISTKLHFENNNWDYYGGINLSLKNPINKSSTMVNNDQIKSGTGIGIQIGIYYRLSSSFYVPFEFEQVIQSKIGEASLNTSLFSLGVGFNF